MEVTIELSDKEVEQLERHLRKRFLFIESEIDSITPEDMLLARVYRAVCQTRSQEKENSHNAT